MVVSLFAATVLAVSCRAPAPRVGLPQPWSRCPRPAATATVDVRATSSGTAALAHDILQGDLVQWDPSEPKRFPQPPTCVLVHGILGSRRNLLSFGKRLVQQFPRWQFVLVDLRCHGETAARGACPGENTVSSAADDVIALLNQLRLYPYMLMGHSFGGKVVMEMVLLSGRVLPRPVQVWVLDTVPGDTWVEAGDHPRDTIDFVRTLPPTFDSRKQLVEALTTAGFTTEGAQWMATNLKPAAGGLLGWAFDLDGIAQLYSSYEKTSLWPVLEKQPAGLTTDFVRASRSAFVWTDADLARIAATGAHVHMLEDSSHWVHIDNPDGLLEIIAPSFERLAPTPP